ncbi:unnamed protein product, partial [Aphanomyces euteiches]
PDTKTDESTQPEKRSEARSGRPSAAKSRRKRTTQQGSNSPPPHKTPKTSHTQAESRAPKARSDGYIAIDDASSDEEPYDSGEDIDQVVTPRLEQSTMECALKESEGRFDRGLENYRSTIPATLSSDGFFDSVSEILHHYGDVIRDLVHQVHNLRYPSGSHTPAEWAECVVVFKNNSALAFLLPRMQQHVLAMVECQMGHIVSCLGMSAFFDT